jgi:hypothetical protein
VEKCCDACGDGEYYFSSCFSASEGAGVSVASIAVDRKSMGNTWLIGRRTKPTSCVFPVFSVAVMGKCCDACGDGEYYLSSCFSALEGAGVSEASAAVDWKSTETTVADRSSNEADSLCNFLCTSCYLLCGYGKVL